MFVVYRINFVKKDIMNLGLKTLGIYISDAINRCISFLCKAGAFHTPDDKSGVKVGGKVYQTFLTLGGDMYYLDDEGKKVFLTDEQKRTDLSNINEKFLGHVIRCYDSGSGLVKVLGHLAYNDNMDILSEKYYVLRSRNLSYPPGRDFTSIPSTWNSTSCEKLEDGFTVSERVECYQKGGTSLVITVLAKRSYDVGLNLLGEKYVVVASNDPDYNTGVVLNAIPNTHVWKTC